MSEKLKRLRAMLDPYQETWDLSPNDVAAIRHVLGLVNELAHRLALQNGTTVPHEIHDAECSVYKGEWFVD